LAGGGEESKIYKFRGISMKGVAFNALVFLSLASLISCVAEPAKPRLTYYHGQTPPKTYFEVIRSASEEILFKIRADFSPNQMYHLILDGDEPVAEGWYPTNRMDEEFYYLKIRAKKGMAFQPGKTYRLCIGTQSPEVVARYRNSYKCLVDYEFVLPSPDSKKQGYYSNYLKAQVVLAGPLRGI
jgi:hypothetical protein